MKQTCENKKKCLFHFEQCNLLCTSYESCRVWMKYIIPANKKYIIINDFHRIHPNNFKMMWLLEKSNGFDRLYEWNQLTRVCKKIRNLKGLIIRIMLKSMDLDLQNESMIKLEVEDFSQHIPSNNWNLRYSKKDLFWIELRIF